MKAFHWGEHFVTGIPEIDKQHYHLVDLINQFGNLLAENDVQMQDVNHILVELEDYALYHFQEEEKFIAETGVDARFLNRHIGSHKGFLGKR